MILSKHIIRCHLLVDGVLTDQEKDIIVHVSIGHHQSLGQHTVGPLLGP
jgi:hypothetical protein